MGRNAKWNRTGIGDRGLEQGSSMGNMKQMSIGNVKHVGEWNQGRGYEQVSRNDKTWDNGPNRARLEDRRRLCTRSKAWPELGR